MVKIKKQFLHYFLATFLLFSSILLVSTLFASILFFNAESVKYCIPFISNCQNVGKEKELNVTDKYEAEKENETPYHIWQQCLNPDLDPCDDFYKYSCSNYNGGYSFLTRDYQHYGLYLYQLANEQIEECFLDTFNSKKSNSSSAIQKMRRYQKEYERTRGVSEEISVQKLIGEINSFGSCPALSLKNDWENNGLVNSLLKMTNLTGLPYLYEFDWISLTEYGIYPAIFPSKLIFSNPSYILKSQYEGVLKRIKKEKIKKFFIQIFERVAGEIKETIKVEKEEEEERRANLMYENGGSGSGQDDYYENYYENEVQAKNYTRIAQELVDLELRLIHIYNELEYFKPAGEMDFTGHYLNSNEYKNQLGIANIENYLFNNARISPDLNKYFYDNGYDVGKEYILTVDNSDNLASFYQNLDTEVLANYLCLRYIFNRMPYLDEDFKQMAREFEEDFEGEVQILPKYNEDTKLHVESIFPLLSDHLFVTHCRSSPNQIAKTQSIVKNVLKTSIKLIENSEWLDLVSQRNALNKLNHTLVAVGASEIAFNQSRLDELYERLDFQETDGIMEMERKLQLFNSWYNLSVLHAYDNHANFKILKERSSVNNAFANKQYNFIYLPLGGLFPPNFDVDQPYSNGYGTIGRMTGHEIFHLLDSGGVNYIFDGTYKSIFEDPETKADFEDRTECLKRQYSRQKDVGGISLDGARTLDEDIADNAGIRVAYYAYMEHLKKNGGDEKVPGYLQYTHEQSFFISYAMHFCSAISPSWQKWKIENEWHTLPEYRVNIPLRNFPEFSKAFNCSVGSKMNPRKKCRVWKKKK